MRILVTNDDGITSPGLHALAKALADDGRDVLVAAPDADYSGSGAAIGRIHADDHIDVSEDKLPDLPDVPAYGVDGPPALCVLAARLGGFGDPPDLVISGINPGCNTGRSVLHSGTVGAALTAANFGVSGLAVSVDVTTGLIHEAPTSEGSPEENGGSPPLTAEQDPPQWETAARLAAGLVDWLQAAPQRTVINLNVPHLALSEVRGLRWAALANFGTVRTAVVESGEGRLQMELRSSDVELPPGSDSALVREGFATVTAIRGVTAAEETPVAELLEQAVLSGAG